MASTAACRAETWYSWMCRSMFSMTTIASSTTIPVARMTPKSVSVLIEKPISLMKAKAPISETGIVIVGMIVLRQVCRKMKMTMTTSRMASASVLSTSRIESLTTSVVSSAIWYCSPGGKLFARRISSAFTLRETSSALADGSWMTPKPTASRAWKRSSDA